jgi:hypothetical protein
MVEIELPTLNLLRQTDKAQEVAHPGYATDEQRGRTECSGDKVAILFRLLSLAQAVYKFRSCAICTGCNFVINNEVSDSLFEHRTVKGT